MCTKKSSMKWDNVSHVSCDVSKGAKEQNDNKHSLEICDLTLKKPGQSLDFFSHERVVTLNLNIYFKDGTG